MKEQPEQDVVLNCTYCPSAIVTGSEVMLTARDCRACLLSQLKDIFGFHPVRAKRIVDGTDFRDISGKAIPPPARIIPITDGKSRNKA